MSSDNKEILFWSDGSASNGSKMLVGPVPSTRAPDAVQACFRAASEACLYHAGEMRKLLLAARRSATVAEMVRLFHKPVRRRCGACRFTVGGFSPCVSHTAEYLRGR